MAKVKTSPKREQPKRETASKTKPEADKADPAEDPAEEDQQEGDDADQQDQSEDDGADQDADESEDGEGDAENDDADADADPDADQADPQDTEISSDSAKQEPKGAKPPADSKKPSAPAAKPKQAGFAARTGRTSTAPAPIKPIGTQRPYLDSPRAFGVRINGILHRFGKGRTLLKHLSKDDFAVLKADSYVADNGAEIVE